MSGKPGHFPGGLFSSDANVGDALPSAALEIATLVQCAPLLQICGSHEKKRQGGGRQVFICRIYEGALNGAGWKSGRHCPIDQQKMTAVRGGGR